MDMFECQDILFRRLVRLEDAFPFVEPNSRSEQLPPRIVLQRVGHDIGARDLDADLGGFAEIIALVEVPEGSYETELIRVVRGIFKRFPLGLRLENAVDIRTVPDPRPPILDDGVYSTPVYIRGHF